VIAHIVLFTPKPDVNEASLRAFARTMLNLATAIPAVKHAKVGRSIAVDPGYERSMGRVTYQFVAVLEFDDTAALLDYLRDPRHARLGKLFWEICADATILEVDWRSANDWNVEELV
jgi:hypothetical protein